MKNAGRQIDEALSGIPVTKVSAQGTNLKIGATGNFPEGKINDDDEVEITIAIAADKENRKVILDFGKPIVWIGLSRYQALDIAKMLTEKADEIKIRR